MTIPFIPLPFAPRPFFVYGTLRPGQGNDYLWEGLADATHDGGAFVNGYRLVGASFPYAIPAMGEVTTGCLVTASSAACWDELVRRMDGLEGCRWERDGDGNLVASPHSHYHRIEVPVYIAETDETVVAWIYVPADHAHVAQRLEHFGVPGNDWSDRPVGANLHRGYGR